MDDLISRQNLLSNLRRFAPEYFNALVNDLILKEPSVQPWIPCSERLPIAQEEVIVSCHDDSGDTSYDYTTCGWVTNDGEYWIADNEINSHVVAWMPLPEPYEERKEE